MTPKPSGDGAEKPRQPFWVAVHQEKRKPKRKPAPVLKVIPKPAVAEEEPVPRRDAQPPRKPVNLAARIVAVSNRERPADQELRESLRRADGLKPGDARWISRAVFAYFRWQSWLDDARPLERRLDQAIGFADTYAHQPQRFPDDDLAGGAVPEWVKGLMEVPVGWIRSLQSEPRLWLRARPGTGAALIEKLGGAEAARPGLLPDSVEYLGCEDLFRTPEFRGGEFEIQDAGSQAVGWCCSPVPGEKWWDMCAGEGGKTLHLADFLSGRGLVFGSDRAAWRLERLHTRAVRAKLSNWQAGLWDESQPPPAPRRFDGVLLDAPCSGVGTWGRNPHARWTVTPDDVTELAALQRRLLSLAAAAVKPGGKLVYAVCTMTHPETSEVCDAFDASHPDFTPEIVANPFGAGEGSARHSFWPHQTKGNGMFVAVWRRNSTKSPGLTSTQSVG